MVDAVGRKTKSGSRNGRKGRFPGFFLRVRNDPWDRRPLRPPDGIIGWVNLAAPSI